MLFLVVGLISCTSTRRILNNTSGIEISPIRVLLEEPDSGYNILVNSKIILSDNSGIIAAVEKGNEISFSNSKGLVNCSIRDQEFRSGTFQITSTDSIIRINDKKFRGIIKIIAYDAKIKIVNRISLEDYIKGVMTKEMPPGKGTENYEALKAFSICVRTYAMNKINENKNFFDIYPDTRDQVYGGVEAETDYTNSIVDETFGEILTYNNKPATIFYHSTCGGFTEAVENVFGKNPIPYLKSIEDGVENYCSISPRYEWTEEYQSGVIIDRLLNAKLVNNSYTQLKDIKIISRFPSGRVNELSITLTGADGNEKEISIFGNSIRSIIRSSDNRSILKSNFFNIEFDGEKIIIEGRGSGHGVGLCQWGAIGQSRSGVSYLEILNHYYPGTKVEKFYD